MSDLEEAFRGIWERRFFANNGPLVQELDRTFAQIIGTNHAVALINAFNGIMLAVKALERSGEVIIPALGAGRTADAVRWAGCVPTFADVDDDGGLDPLDVQRRIGPNTMAVIGVHLDGFPCDAPSLEAMSNACGLPMLFDSRESALGSMAGRNIGTFGTAEIFMLTGPAGAAGCSITTNHAGLYALLRTMRSFHAGETFAPAELRANGKMSEAQAALAIHGLRVAAHGANVLDALRDLLTHLDGLALVEARPSGKTGPFVPIVLSVEPEIWNGGAPAFATRLQGAGIVAHAYGAPPEGFPVAARVAKRRLRIDVDMTSPDGIAALEREMRALA